ncbi:uncharacterized protein L969DRAFT_235585 [Mixia osmundae IAM 14324]|uniref:uncharacterized protein n=1 Tax=Mixia osmundae (strain CBS 9802 / IAM 14324 / JCM 22182 / KY 12970) TaxID=764103 RepID=UPI0004A5482F|nr:uncharacterized protein L969DRAFT_235585 [Mixia osmundae IAM 14324]KEI36883.1 hypothetical protein L969DRAFT_235585 [Mixia osmundae IAM 14324]
MRVLVLWFVIGTSTAPSSRHQRRAASEASYWPPSGPLPWSRITAEHIQPSMIRAQPGSECTVLAGDHAANMPDTTIKGAIAASKSSVRQSTELPMPGRPGHLTDDQAKGLAELKKLLSEHLSAHPTTPFRRELLTDDGYLCRYLRARSFEAHKSKDLLLKSEAWRKDFKLDELYSTWNFPEQRQVKKHWSVYFHSTDRFGRPICVNHAGVKDYKALCKIVSPERLIQNFAVEVETTIKRRYPSCTKAKGSLVDCSLLILDLKDISLSQFYSMRSVIHTLLTFSQDVFPETSGRIMVINAPTAFTYIWSWAQSYLAQRTISKISFLGHDYLPKLLGA